MKPEYIIIHHSLTEDGTQVDWKAIKDYHIKENGWSDIGYHYGLEYVGGIIQVMKGRADTEEGAHCKDGGMNSKSIGVCFVGNFDKYNVPNEQWVKGILLVEQLMLKHGIKSKNVLGHGECMRAAKASYIKSCPGEKFSMEKFRKEVA